MESPGRASSRRSPPRPVRHCGGENRSASVPGWCGFARRRRSFAETCPSTHRRRSRHRRPSTLRAFSPRATGRTFPGRNWTGRTATLHPTWRTPSGPGASAAAARPLARRDFNAATVRSDGRFERHDTGAEDRHRALHAHRQTAAILADPEAQDPLVLVVDTVLRPHLEFHGIEFAGWCAECFALDESHGRWDATLVVVPV